MKSINASTLTRWHETLQPRELDASIPSDNQREDRSKDHGDASRSSAKDVKRRSDNRGNPQLATPFVADQSINRRVALWNGPIWQLQVDAIVNSTNESLRDTTGICRKILDAAGNEIYVELDAVNGCRTGEAISTRGCRLPARRIIHTVGPKYNPKYHNAAENALHMCYRNVLSVAKEEQLPVVAVSCIYTRKKGYPREEAAHIACRTVRRFLEHFVQDFELVIFCVDCLEDQMIYDRILPLYFPRNELEQQDSVCRLPHDLGDEFGEPIIEERKIRIADFVSELQSSQHAVEATDSEETSMEEFFEMSANPDIERLERIRRAQAERERKASARSAGASQHQHITKTYETVLAKAKCQSFDDLEKMNFFYCGGVDHSGSPVFVYVGNLVPVAELDLDRVLMYIVSTMDVVVDKEYSVLYIHSGVTSENQPQAEWLRRFFDTFSVKYHRNLKFFYIYQPTLWLRLIVFVGQSVMSRAFYQKIVYIHKQREIANIASNLRLPAYLETQQESESE